jgi:hypothetical protein
MVFIAMLAAGLASEVRRAGDDSADMIILPEYHPNPLPPESGTAGFRTENRVSACCCPNALWLPRFRGAFKLFFELDEVPLPVQGEPDKRYFVSTAYGKVSDKEPPISTSWIKL